MGKRRETGTFPDFAILRANAFGFKLTLKCMSILCTGQTASTYPCVAERGGGYAGCVRRGSRESLTNALSPSLRQTVVGSQVM